MRILGVDLPRGSTDGGGADCTLVLLDERGRVSRVERPDSLPAVAPAVGEMIEGEPFLLGVNVPVVVPAKPARARPVESQVRRRFGLKIPAGGRASLSEDAQGVTGETLMAGLAAGGHPCLPYPDRDRRQTGLAETWAPLVVRSLLWERSVLATSGDRPSREELFRAYAAPAFRRSQARVSSVHGCFDLMGSVLLPSGAYSAPEVSS